MGTILASDWSRAGGTSGDVTSGEKTADQWEKRIVGSDKSRDVGNPLTSGKKGIVGSDKSRDVGNPLPR